MAAVLELPPGFRFHPTDDELVNHYLCRKCASQPLAVPIIREIDLYKYDPWELPELAMCGENEWYFFSPRDRKYPNGSRPNRAAGSGYWKATGVDKPIGKPKPLGIKKSLVFYAGRASRGIKTDWIMHEYRLANVDRSSGKKKNLRLDDWVLCRIYNKKGSLEKYGTMTQKMEELTEIQETKKSDVKMFGQNMKALPMQSSKQQPVLMNFQFHMDMSDSLPKLHTDSSSSDFVHSPDIKYEKEVQSEPKWKELEDALDLQFNYLGNDLLDDPFAPPAHYYATQLSPLQDMFMYLQNPF